MFDVNILEWCSYRFTFSSLVHKNTLLSDMEKFYNLISTISEMAAPIVKVMPLFEINYFITWETI